MFTFFSKPSNIMIKSFSISFLVMLLSIIITSCGSQITPCGCKNSNDPDYQKRCEKWLIGAFHDEYVRFKAEMDNCGEKDETDSKNVPDSDSSKTPYVGMDKSLEENTSVMGLETEENKVDQGLKRQLTRENWTLKEKKQWVSNCINGVNATSLNKMSIRIKKDYCTCMFEKVTAKYPDKFDNVNMEIAKEFAMDCFTEALK